MKKELHFSIFSIGNIIDQFDQHICLLDQEGTIIIVNDSWKNFLEEKGSPIVSFEGHNYFEVEEEEEEYSQRFVTGIKEVLSGTKESCEVLYPCHSPSEKRWFKAIAKKVEVEGKSYVLIIHENVSKEDDHFNGKGQNEINGARDALERNKERLLLTLESAKIGTFDWYPEEDQVFWDSRLFEIFEIAPSNQIDLNTHFFSLVHPDDKERVGAEFQESLQVGGRANHEIEYRVLVNGKTKHILAHSRMIRDDRGVVIRMLGASQDITEIREAEHFHQLVLDSAGIGTFENYLPENVSKFDQRFREIFGIDKDQEDSTEVFFSRLHEEDIHLVRQHYEEWIRKNGPDQINLEYRIVVGGQVKHILGYGQVFRDIDGEAMRIVGTVQDITQRKKSEERLKNSEQLFRSIVQDQDEMIVRWKPDGIRTFVNRAYLDFYDLKEEDVIGTSFFNLISPDDRERVKNEIEELSPDNPTRENTHRVLLSDGKIGWQKWMDRAFFDEEGKVIEYQSVGSDITDIVHAQEALVESEKRYRNVFNQQFQFTALLDLEGRVIHINDFPLKVQGLTREDYLGKYFWDSPVFSGNKEWKQKVKSQVLTAKETRVPLIVEDLFYGKDKETRYATASYSIIESNKGELENILVQAIDITEEKRSKRMIEERERQLSMIYNTSNDFMLLLRVENGAYIIESINDSSLKGLWDVDIHVEKSDLEGISVQDYFENILQYSPEEMHIHLNAYAKAVNSKKPVSYTTDSNYNDHFFSINTTVTPIIDSKQVTRILTVSRDITEIVSSKIEIEKAYKEIKELKSQLEQENIYLKEEIKQTHDYENMVFVSNEFRELLDQVENVAKTTATVLIMGETGTGKELIARAIHENSRRKDKPMIKVNVAAIPRDLIESELFGYEKGAFTGATSSKPGKFELADGGTIFLDEIGDMPLDLQVKILRVLQEEEVERLGSTKTKKISVRVIAATNKDLNQAVKDNEFREDLFFRLNVFPLELPPLRSRPEDIPILVEHFISKYSVKHSKAIEMIPKKVMNYLMNYPWPGNVRELENTVERSVILAHGHKLTIPVKDVMSADDEAYITGDSLDEIQEQHIRKILIKCGWKIEGEKGAAAQLQIKPSTLRDKMKKFGISRPK